jgi:cell division protein ZapB
MQDADCLASLERQISRLMSLSGRLAEENRSLRRRLDALAQDRAQLIQKNEQARSRLEAMIDRLRTLEHGD